MNEDDDKVPMMAELAQYAYERNGNPLHVWSAYTRCRKAGVEIPDWMLQYFDRVANNFSELCLEPPKEVAPAVAEALEMKAPGKGGRGNVFKKFEDTLSLREDVSPLQMAGSVALYVRRGHKPGQAVEYVAREYNVGKSTVDRAVKKYPHTLLSSKK